MRLAARTRRDRRSSGKAAEVADALREDGAVADSVTAQRWLCAKGAAQINQGHLFVDDQPLSDSPLRHHPLNPMTDSALVRLLSAQTRHPVCLIDRATVRRGVEAVRDAVVAHRQAGVRHIVADALTDDDLAVLGAATLGLPVVAGAAGLAEGERLSATGRPWRSRALHRCLCRRENLSPTLE
ncbi:four-carbon acid sugar kinase family protein [Streptomyces sp. WG7]|uniref:four-carbon acid sugar kinase family protein n=1 Tax=Streptomyces sp. WG7 TaxID=3417650 RepID=UPI003CF8F2D2